MNVGPIAMNAAANGSATGDAANAQAAKSSGLPSFAQVLTGKQSAGVAPNNSNSSAASSSKNSQNVAVNQPSQTSSETSSAEPAKTATPTAPPEKETLSGATQKTVGKNKLPTDSQGNQTVATAASLGTTAAMLALLPVSDPGAIQFSQIAPMGQVQVPVDPPQSVPMNETNVPKLPPQQERERQQENAQSPAVATLPNLPVASLAEAIPHLQSAEPVPAVVTTDSPAKKDGSDPTEPATSQSVATAQQAATSLPVTSETPSFTTLPLTDTAPLAGAPTAPSAVQASTSIATESGKSPAAAPGNHQASVAELVRNFASAAAKTGETVAQVTANVVHDVVGAIRNKSASDKNSALAMPLPNVPAKNQSLPNGKQEAAAATVVQAAAKPASGKNAGTAGDNADTGDSASSDGNATAATEQNVKTKSLALDPPALPTTQSSPSATASSGAIQAAGVVSLAAAKETAVGSRAIPSNTSPNNASALPDPDDTKLPPSDSKVINVSQLSGTDAHSEVRIAMQADQLGQVELHATLNGQQVGAAITVEKKEAHAALAVELPSLQQALEEKNLRVSEVVLAQSAMHSTAGDAGRGGNPHAGQHPNPIARQYQQAQPEAASAHFPAVILESPGIFDGYGHLSVRA